MTYEEARLKRRNYVAVALVTGCGGFLIVVVTFLKFAYQLVYHAAVYGGGGLGAMSNAAIKNSIDWLYQNGVIIAPLWPWMSDTGIAGTFFSPSLIAGFALIVVPMLSTSQAVKLRRWIVEVKELLVKEQMAASLRSPSPNQSIGDVSSGRDTKISQQITNHYNNHPDSPMIPLIAALIGAAAAIIAAFIK